MRTIGLIGGMSWEASIVYYRIINETVRDRLGGHATPPSVMVTVEFGKLEERQRAGDWKAAGAMVADAAVALEGAGAECVVICANTMHIAAGAVRAAVPGLPLLHIGDATGEAVRAAGLSRVLLLGTRYTMELPFLRDHLREHHGVETDVPGDTERAELQRIIYEELTLGRVEPASRDAVRRMCDGADGVILACTELTLLGLDGFDTTRLHAEAAVSFALQ
jgi:amino-acid racemase